MKKIVIPYDFSTESGYALNAAVQFSKVEPSELHLIHVVEIPSGFLSLYPEYSGIDIGSVYSDEIVQRVEEKLAKVEQEVSSKGVNVTSEILYGKPFESIQQTIVKEDADMIIMGSKGATGLREIFVGSNAERVIRYSKVPVLTVKQEVDFSGMSDMVYATDFSVNQSIELVKYLQKVFGLKVKLLKVFNSNDWVYTEGSALEKIEKFALDNHFRDYSYHVIDSPFVTDGILKFAHEEKTDLIVMGTHGYTGIGHLIAGSNSEGVANHSKIPIFTTRR